MPTEIAMKMNGISVLVGALSSGMFVLLYLIYKRAAKLASRYLWSTYL